MIDDKNYFEELFRTYYSQLFFIAKGILLDEGVAEEIVQDVFIKIWESGGLPKIDGSLKAYLAVMTRNHCIDYLRRQNSAKHLQTVSLDNRNVRAALLDVESDDFIREELFADPVVSALRRAINELPAQCQQIFRLSRFEGYSHAQIAEMLNISVSTVKTQLSRALQKLRKEMTVGG
ncbi:MAG: RNA polymerase sigma-70 factor [Dysgonamonadaceae bacterium]|jgi:RNA polymerase sigma-70 factor (ECF subfamily)|nr:RNA polymerase sigma-70 factor [Dysgonamonadaceae bacterium]